MKLDMNDGALHVAVPTATIIISSKADPFMVVVLRSRTKFPGKLLLPGGKVQVGHDTWTQTVIKESRDEVAIKPKLESLKFFAIASRPDRDIRNIGLKEFLDGNPKPEGLPDDIKITSHHSFDVIFMALTNEVPTADHDEAKEAFFVDVRTMNPEEYALDHGRILMAYHDYLNIGILPGLDQF